MEGERKEDPRGGEEREDCREEEGGPTKDRRSIPS